MIVKISWYISSFNTLEDARRRQLWCEVEIHSVGAGMEGRIELL